MGRSKMAKAAKKAKGTMPGVKKPTGMKNPFKGMKNPLKGMKGYQPIQKGMQAVLPEIDVFNSAHNLDSLLELENYLWHV